MNDKRREELQELIRSGAGDAETFATIDAEHQEAAANTKSLANQRRRLMQKVEAIDSAKKELAEAGPPTAAVAQTEDDVDSAIEDEPDSETESEGEDEVEDESEEK